MDNPITCLLVEDEPLARRLLERFVARTPSLTLVGLCANAVEALEVVYETQPHLLFLDVQMPEMTGFGLLDVLTTSRPQVVLTTAFPQYAVRGFDYQVTDYLLKPIRFERFLQAVNKVRAAIKLRQAQPVTPPALAVPDRAGSADPPPPSEQYVWVRVNKKQLHLRTQDILFVESIRDYVQVHLSTQTLTIHSTLQKMELLLPPAQFIRINRSYIVRLDAIAAVEGNSIELLNKQQLPIGICYRELIRQRLR